MDNIFSLKLLQFSKKLGTEKNLINLASVFAEIIKKELGGSNIILIINEQALYPLIIDNLPISLIKNLDNKTIISCKNPQIDYPKEPYFFFENIKNFYIFPLLSSNKSLGCLYIENYELEADTYKFINLLVTQGAIYFENVLLLTNIEEKMRERTLSLETSKRDISELNKLIKKINSMTSFNEVMQKVIEYVEARFTFKYYTFGKISENTYGKILFANLPKTLDEEEIKKIINTKYILNRHSIFFKNFLKGNKENLFRSVQNLKLNEDEDYFMQTLKTKTVLIIPSSALDETPYFLTFYSQDDIVLSNEEISIMSLLAENLFNLYISIKNNNEIKTQIKLSEMAKETALRAQKETEKINEMISTVIQSIDINSLFYKLLSVLKKNYNLNSFFIYFLNEETEELVFENLITDILIDDNFYNFINNSKIDLKENPSLHKKIIDNKVPILIDKFKELSISEKLIIENIDLQWLYIVPLVYSNKTFGILNVGNYSLDRVNIEIFNDKIKKEYENFIHLITPSIYNSIQKIKIEKAYRDLNLSQNELIQKEKFAALGQLITTIAHEINSPLGAIKGNAENLKANFEDFTNINVLELGTLDPEKIFFIQKIINDNRNLISMPPKIEREKKKELKNKLKERNLNPDLADYLIDCRIYDINEDVEKIIYEKNVLKILNILKNLSGFHHKIKNIETAVDKSSKILVALKSYTSSSQEEGTKKFFSLKETINYLLDIYQSHINENIEIVKNYQEDFPDFYGNKEEISQVIINLILNSLQALNNEGKLKINLLFNKESETIIFTLVDNSKNGIPIDIQDKIFNPFFTTKNEHNTGLGLHACKNIIQKHNGRIDFISIPGRTEFFIFLPVKKIK